MFKCSCLYFVVFFNYGTDSNRLSMLFIETTVINYYSTKVTSKPTGAGELVFRFILMLYFYTCMSL